jgi:hypothetical protein
LQLECSWANEETLSHTRWKLSILRSPEISEGNATLFTTTAELWSDKRKLYLTSKEYVGLGPSVLQKNDVVAVLFGCLVPLILRQQRDEYRLFGETYMHGTMKGEAIGKWREHSLRAGYFSTVGLKTLLDLKSILVYRSSKAESAV